MRIEKPTTSADAIRAVCYVKAWTARKLAEEIKGSETHLSAVLNHHSGGSMELTARILACLPEGTWEG